MMEEIKRLPSMIDGLSYIRRCGVPVDFVIDVGILSCTYPLIKVFPDKKHVLVEPVRSFHKNIESIYRDNGIDYMLCDFAAGSVNGNLVLCEYGKKSGENVITHSSIYRSIVDAPTVNLLSSVSIEVRRIDSLVSSVVSEIGLVGSDYFYLLKIDVDGSEEEIIEGALGALDRCSIVVLEVPITKLLGRVSLMEGVGFKCVDLVDPCYYKGALSQVDCIFVKNSLVRLFAVDPWLVSSTIDFDKWYEGRYTHVS